MMCDAITLVYFCFLFFLLGICVTKLWELGND